MKRKNLIIGVLLLTITLTAWAHIPKGGLADTAISPDGSILVAGGDSRTLYVLDPATLEIKNRIWLKTNIYEMEFNKDGKVLVVEDTSEALHFISVKDWKVFKKVTKAGSFSAAPAVDLLAGLAGGYKKSTIKFISMSDGSLKGQVEFPGKVDAIGLDVKGSRLVVLAPGPKGKETKKNKPNGLRGEDADLFVQQNDGKISILAEYKVPSGQKIKEQEIYYSTRTPVIMVGEKQIRLIGYSNINATIEGSTITLFKGKSSYNYGVGLSPDRKFYLLGGLRQGTRIVNDTLGMTTFKLDTLPGWPEYYKGFGFAADGTGYAVTTAYRLVKISKEGTIVKAVPLY